MLNDSYSIDNAVTDTARVNNTVMSKSAQIEKAVMFSVVVTSVNIHQNSGPIKNIQVLLLAAASCSYCSSFE